MREILYRNLTSEDRRKRDCLLTELMDEGGTTTHLEKRCTYFVKRSAAVVEQETQQALEGQGVRVDAATPHHIFVRKERDNGTGIERFTYKVLGHFYVMMGERMFTVAYRHMLQMEIAGNNQDTVPPTTT